MTPLSILIGARLTAYEIVSDNLPGTLVTDSMASALMAVKGVDVVIVGADRVTANGDTANKIGMVLIRGFCVCVCMCMVYDMVCDTCCE